MGDTILGLGTDIVDVARIADILVRHADSFPARHFTAEERAYCDEGRGGARAQRYAARFAAKEACAKALGTGLGAEAGWLEIEVRREASGRPTLRLHGTAAATARRLGATRLLLTLAHERHWAVATVLLLGTETDHEDETAEGEKAVDAPPPAE